MNHETPADIRIFHGKPANLFGFKDCFNKHGYNFGNVSKNSVFIVNFKHISYLVKMLPLLTLSS